MTSLIQEELSKLILRVLEFSGALVTVTEVEVQKDLDYALVKISVIPSEKGEWVLKVLEKNRRRLQFLLADQIRIKPMPELRFQIRRAREGA